MIVIFTIFHQINHIFFLESSAEKAPKEVEQSAALKKDAAATLRKIRSANPEERGNKKKKKTSKRKSKQGKGKKANKKRKNTLKQRRENNGQGVGFSTKETKVVFCFIYAL